MRGTAFGGGWQRPGVIYDGIEYNAEAWEAKCARDREAKRMEHIEALLERLVELLEKALQPEGREP